MRRTTMSSDNSSYTVPPPGVAAPPVLTPVELERAQEHTRADERRSRKTEANRKRWGLFNAFVDAGFHTLNGSAAKVWLVLFRHADSSGRTCLSRNRIVDSTGLTTRTVRTAIQDLERSGWVKRVKRGMPSGGVSVFEIMRPTDRGKNIPKQGEKVHPNTVFSKENTPPGAPCRARAEQGIDTPQGK